VNPTSVVDAEFLEHLRAHPPAAAVPQLAEASRRAQLIRACIEIVPVMQILAIPDAAASKLERRIQLRQSAAIRLRIRFLSFDNPAQLTRQHCADASALLCREGPRALQKALVDLVKSS
jgi:hypothetical protein